MAFNFTIISIAEYYYTKMGWEQRWEQNSLGTLSLNRNRLCQQFLDWEITLMLLLGSLLFEKAA